MVDPKSEALCASLTRTGIPFELFEHEAVFTCEDVEKLPFSIPGTGTKNLFLRDDKALRHFLVSVRHECTVDLKEFSAKLGVKKLSFASADRLKQFLGVEPGSVTLLGLVNDVECQVELIVEAALWKSELLQCHPLVNTATVVISRVDLERLCALTQHTIKVMEIPQRRR